MNKIDRYAKVIVQVTNVATRGQNDHWVTVGPPMTADEAIKFCELLGAGNENTTCRWQVYSD